MSASRTAGEYGKWKPHVEDGAGSWSICEPILPKNLSLMKVRKQAFRRLEATGIELFYPIPTPVPTAGIPASSKAPFVCQRFIVVRPLCGIPDYGRFYGSRGPTSGSWPRSPKTSRLAHAKTSSPTDGFNDSRTGVLYQNGRVERVCSGAKTAPSHDHGCAKRAHWFGRV